MVVVKIRRFATFTFLFRQIHKKVSRCLLCDVWCLILPPFTNSEWKVQGNRRRYIFLNGRFAGFGDFLIYSFGALIEDLLLKDIRIFWRAKYFLWSHSGKSRPMSVPPLTLLRTDGVPPSCLKVSEESQRMFLFKTWVKCLQCRVLSV